MKRVIWSVACVVALTGANTAFASPAAVHQEATAKTPDKTLDSRIEQRLKGDPSLKKFNVKVSVDGGIATLTGTVATDAEKARAASLANIRGVTRVENQIEVDPASAAKGTTGKIEDKTKEGAEKTKEGAEKAYDKTKEGMSKTGEVITDTWITGHVKERFMGEDALKGSDIDVDTTDHVVTLKGTVASAAGRARAMQLAKTTQGVKKVVDRLVVAPK